MLDFNEFLLRVQLSQDVIEVWLSEGWLRPRRTGTGPVFSEIDVSRAQLIQDLQDDFGVNEEGIAIILDLIDQLHGLRKTLRELCGAIGVQQGDLQHRILSEMRSKRPIQLKGPDRE